MEFDFDRVTDRTGTFAAKYDLAAKRNKPLDAISLWVADMDFPTAPCIQKALADRAAHGNYGYSLSDARDCSEVRYLFKWQHSFDNNH